MSHRRVNTRLRRTVVAAGSVVAVAIAIVTIGVLLVQNALHTPTAHRDAARPVPSTSAPSTTAKPSPPPAPKRTTVVVAVPSQHPDADSVGYKKQAKRTSPPPVPGSAGPVAAVVAITNLQRALHGCGPLRVNVHLVAAAQGHSADMAANDYFSHDSQNGDTPWDRMKAAGYVGWTLVGENIAAGQRSAQDVMTAWMNSPGHRANILNCGFTEIGVGYAVSSTGTPYWTQDFGRR